MVLVLRLVHYVFRGQTLVIDMPASLAHEEIGLERFQPGVGSDDIELGEPNGVGKVGRYRAWARFVQQPPRGFVKVDDALVFQIHLSLIGLGSSSSIDEDAFGLEIYQGPVAAGGQYLGFDVGIIELDEPFDDADDDSSASCGLAKVGHISMKVFSHGKDGFERRSGSHCERCSEDFI